MTTKDPSSLPVSPNTSSRKPVLLIGLDPKAVDFTQTPGLDEAKLSAFLKAGLDEIVAAGFDAEWCLTDHVWESAEAMVSAKLAEKRYAAIMIGAGIRAIPAHFLLFERIINLVHEGAPGAKLCFNTSPDNPLAALLRWVKP